MPLRVQAEATPLHQQVRTPRAGLATAAFVPGVPVAHFRFVAVDAPSEDVGTVICSNQDLILPLVSDRSCCQQAEFVISRRSTVRRTSLATGHAFLPRLATDSRYEVTECAAASTGPTKLVGASCQTRLLWQSHLEED